MLARGITVDKLNEVGEDALFMGLCLAEGSLVLSPQLVDVPEKRADEAERDLCIMFSLVHILIEQIVDAVEKVELFRRQVEIEVAQVAVESLRQMIAHSQRE